MKRLVSFILLLGIFLSMNVQVFAMDTKDNKYSIGKEKTLCKKLHEEFLNQATFDVSKYIPDGGELLSVDKIGQSIIIDYLINDERFLVEYFNNGDVEKTFKKKGSKDVYIVSSENQNMKHINVDNIIETTERTEDEVDRLMAQLMENGTYRDRELTLQSGKKDVIPIKYTEVSDTIPFNAKLVSSGTVTIPELANIGYNVNQRYRIYETMDYHTEILRSGPSFNAGDAITAISATFEVVTTKMLSWLTAAGVAYTIYNKLEEACRIVDDNSYKFLGGKEVTIYDPTYEKTDVEVVNEWGEGKISLTWGYSGGYRSPSWAHTARSSALQMLNSTARDNARNSYNNNIKMFGVWKWGVGRLGY